MNNNLDFNKLSDLEINDDIVCQSIFVELNLKKSSTIIGVVYRPPNGDIKKFNDYINNTLSKLNNSKKSIYIMGDFNINLLNSETCNLTSDFFEIMLSHSLCPTRITTYCATLIDNIFSNNYSQPVTSGILQTDISDHLPIFRMDESIPKARLTSYTYKKKNSKENVGQFIDSLRSFDWSAVFSTTDPNSAYSLFFDQINILYNQHIPLTRINLRKHQPQKAWITQGLIKSIKSKN